MIERAKECKGSKIYLIARNVKQIACNLYE